MLVTQKETAKSWRVKSSKQLKGGNGMTQGKWTQKEEKELEDVKKQFDIYKAKMESLLISQLEILKEINKD